MPDTIPPIPPVCDKPTDLYPSIRLMIERDTTYRMYADLYAAVREYFEAADAWEAAMNNRNHEEACEWSDRQREREAAMRRLVGMEKRDDT